MAKNSISLALRRLRRVRILTLLASLVLVAALGQLILSSGVKKTQAYMHQGWSIDTTADTCVANLSPSNTNLSIPVECEGRDITINGYTVSGDESHGSVFADAVSVWQSPTTHYVCPAVHPGVGNESFVYYQITYPIGETPRCWFTNTPSNPTGRVEISRNHSYGPNTNSNHCIAPTIPVHYPASTDPLVTFTYFDHVSADTQPCKYYAYLPADGTVTKTTAASRVTHTEGSQCYASGATQRFNAAMEPDCNTNREFNSLVIKGGATLTHAAVSADDLSEDIAGYGGTPNDGSLAGNTTGSGRWKKVDLELTTDLKLEGNSKINVDGKGYRGGGCKYDRDGTNQKCNGSDELNGFSGYSGSGTPTMTGYGPGAGTGTWGTDNSCTSIAAGAGFGGVGGSVVGTCDSAAQKSGGVKYPASFDPADPVFDFGSGGGGARQYWMQTYVNGGSGGGRIRVIAAKITVATTAQISAKGADGGNIDNGDDHAKSGGGSGGMIYLDSTDYSFVSDSATDSDINGGGFIRSVDNIVTNTLSLSKAGTIYSPVKTYNLFVTGGQGIAGTNSANASAAGGGGRIVIVGPESGISITKQLFADSRPGVGSAFNPYALQKGDKIMVQVKVGTFTGSNMILSDMPLSLPTDPTKYCKYEETPGFPKFTPAGGTTTSLNTSYNTPMKFTVPPKPETTIEYYCVVQ